MSALLEILPSITILLLALTVVRLVGSQRRLTEAVHRLEHPSSPFQVSAAGVVTIYSGGLGDVSAPLARVEVDQDGIGEGKVITPGEPGWFRYDYTEQGGYFVGEMGQGPGRLHLGGELVENATVHLNMS